MGRPMALHLLKAGYRVAVYARRPDAAAPLLAAGATLVGAPSKLAAQSDVVMTNVTTTADVEQVLLGPDGVIHGARPGTIVIDFSTIAPQATKRIAATLAERGIEMLDAPVSGGPAGAEGATLVIMVGGDEKTLSAARPMLERLGTKIVHMGSNGAGQVAKACNQLALLVNAEGTAEALALGVRYGLDPSAVREALLGGIAASRVLEVFGKRMAERDFTPGMAARLYDKDIGFVLELARDAGLDLPAASLVRRRLDELVAEGKTGQDLASIIELIERR
jgi:3-hydroxyisobutyrate dehydrogenase-like beta-hydroxyacid dehydrogenase